MARGSMVIALLAGLLLLHVQESGAQQLSARARIDSTAFLVGDRIHVTVDLRHTRGLTIQPLVGDSTEGFTILGRSPLSATSDTTSTMEFVLARYDSGDAVIPPLPFMFFVPKDTASHIAVTNQLVVTIHTMPQDSGATFRDIKPPLDIPITWEEIALYAGIILVAAALGYGAYRYWKRRVRAAAGDAGAAPPRPAHILALEALGDLKAKKLWQQGLLKEYYSELTEILRRYIEQRYNVPALEEPTGETLNGLRSVKVGDALLSAAEVILRRADLVKFAKGRPTVTDHEDSFRGVVAFVEKTKLQPLSPVVGEQAKGDGHVES